MRPISIPFGPCRLLAAAVLICLLSARTAKAQTVTYTDLHDFGGTVVNAGGASGPDGESPDAGATFDSSGNMYGTTYMGGPHGFNPAGSAFGNGIVWKRTAAGQYKDLHDFGGTVINADGLSGPDGAWPVTDVAFDSSGNLYGTTNIGGANGSGIVWEITSGGVYTDLHDFGGPVLNANGIFGEDGSFPSAGVTFDSVGNMYGTTSSGGANPSGGMLWEITKAGAYIDLHDFGETVTNANGAGGPDGETPYAKVAFDGAGNMYGTAYYGGANGTGFNHYGMVWELTASGQYEDLHDFGGAATNANGTSGPDGAYPDSSITFDSSGNMFGTAASGGANSLIGNPSGMLWEITAARQYKDLHDFGGTVTVANGANGPDGTIPKSGVTLDTSGNMYGQTTCGGGGPVHITNGSGMVWEMTAAGAYVDLHDFGGTITNAGGASGPDGSTPYGNIVFRGGNLFGTAFYGGPYRDIPTNGSYGNGMVWEITGGGGTVQQAPTPQISPSSESFSGSVQVSITDTLSGATIRYTTDGTDPATSSTAHTYSTPFTLTTTMTVKAIAEKSGYTNSAEASATYTLVTSLTVFSLVFNPTITIGGDTLQGTVTLSEPVSTNTFIPVTSSSGKATIPNAVIVPAGQSSVSFTIDTSLVTVATLTTIKAALGVSSQSATLTIDPLMLTALTLAPTSVIGGASSTGTIELNGAAPFGATITVASNNATATTSNPIVIAPGLSSANFTINTSAVPVLTSATMKATLGTIAKSAILSIKPLTLTSLVLAPTSVIGGNSSMATLKLSGVAPTDTNITVTSSNGAATVTSPVTVPAGQSFVTFTVNTIPVAVNTIATMKATLGTSVKSAAITVKAPTITSFSLNPTSAVGGAGTSTLTITLSGNAPTAGLPIKLTSSVPTVLAVSNTIVPGGTSTVQVTLSPKAVTAQKTVTVTGTLNGVSHTATLTVTP